MRPVDQRVTSFLKVKQSQARCARMCLQTSSVVRERAQLRLTLMLVGTVAMFIVGHVPIAFAYTVIFEAVFGEEMVGSECLLHLNVNGATPPLSVWCAPCKETLTAALLLCANTLGFT